MSGQGKHTPGPWLLATSNSWRRFVSESPDVRGNPHVCEPITQNDGHPDLHFANGGPDGPDAHLIAAAPELLEALEMADEIFSREIDESYGEVGKQWVQKKNAALRRARGEQT